MVNRIAFLPGVCAMKVVDVLVGMTQGVNCGSKWRGSCSQDPCNDSSADDDDVYGSVIDVDV